jgi:hypothetical protein
MPTREAMEAEKSGAAQNKMNRSAQGVAVAQGLVPAEFAFIAILPAPARVGAWLRPSRVTRLKTEKEHPK